MRIGDKVVCIRRRAWNDQSIYQSSGHILPHYMQMLTVRTISHERKGTFLRFEEIKNKPNSYSDITAELQFSAKNFRRIAPPDLARELAQSFIKQDRRRKESERARNIA